MLKELSITNFAIIDEINLKFGENLIILTGETGAGKSIIIDAVNILLGGRADSSLIRTGAERASIQGIFKLDPQVRPRVDTILQENTIDSSNFLILTRDIRRDGPNTARINGQSANMRILQEIGNHLIDIHGQTEHFSLKQVSQHITLLDRFASSEKEYPKASDFIQKRNHYNSLYSEIKVLEKYLADIYDLKKDATTRQEILEYRINEIESARLVKGEEENLESERNRLVHSEQISKLTREIIEYLDEGGYQNITASDLIGQAFGNTRKLVELDQQLKPFSNKLQSILEDLGNVSGDLRIYLSEVEHNPERLRIVEDRLVFIQALKNKYRGDIDHINNTLEESRDELESLLSYDDKLRELKEKIGELLSELSKTGNIISKHRKTSSQLLKSKMEKQISELNMGKAQFQIKLHQELSDAGVRLDDGRIVSWFPEGFETVEFMIAPNPGEGLKPLAKIASGGENSRLMLALKNVLAKADSIPTLIFDEIDQGIGGRIGSVVGEKLWKLSRDHQVLCVTHLPQMAGFADQHLQVEKLQSKQRTTTKVNDLSGKQREIELAQMLGGVSPSNLQSASDIISNAENIKKALS